MVAGVLSLFIIVPIVVFIIWNITGIPGELPPMDYADRHAWHAVELRPRELEYDMLVAAETGKQYRKANFPITPTEEAMLHRCVAMVQRDLFFEDAANLDTLKKLTDEYPDQFYPPFLIARWLEKNGNLDEGEHWRQVAFSRATGAIVQRLVDAEGNVVPHHSLPSVAIGYDRIIDGKRNATLMLIYPFPTSDERGQITLPTFESIYRLTDPALPPGVDPPLHTRALTLLPQAPLLEKPNWFSSPYRVGRLADGVVEPEAE